MAQTRPRNAPGDKDQPQKPEDSALYIFSSHKTVLGLKDSGRQVNIWLVVEAEQRVPGSEPRLLVPVESW